MRNLFAIVTFIPQAETKEVRDNKNMGFAEVQAGKIERFLFQISNQSGVDLPSNCYIDCWNKEVQV